MAPLPQWRQARAAAPGGQVARLEQRGDVMHGSSQPEQNTANHCYRPEQGVHLFASCSARQQTTERSCGQKMRACFLFVKVNGRIFACNFNYIRWVAAGRRRLSFEPKGRTLGPYTNRRYHRLVLPGLHPGIGRV
jgi:hypothetical protein